MVVTKKLSRCIFLSSKYEFNTQPSIKMRNGLHAASTLEFSSMPQYQTKYDVEAEANAVYHSSFTTILPT